MNILEITVQRKTRGGWPVVAELIESGQLPRRCEGTLRLEGDWRSPLLGLELDPRAYGTVLGEALFRDWVRDALMQARAASQGSLRLLLIVEDEALKSLHWEWLCAPIRLGGRCDLLVLDQQVLFSRYLPSLTDRRFPAIGRRDLRALVLVASPPAGNRYNLAPFDALETVASIGAALGEIPYDVLHPPTLDELMIRITGQHYTLPQIVAHGAFRGGDGETILYLLDAGAEVQPVTATRFLDRSGHRQGHGGRGAHPD